MDRAGVGTTRCRTGNRPTTTARLGTAERRRRPSPRRYGGYGRRLGHHRTGNEGGGESRRDHHRAGSGGEPLLRLFGLRARLLSSPGWMQADMSIKSDRGKEMTLESWLNPHDLTGEARLNLQQFQHFTNRIRARSELHGPIPGAVLDLPDPDRP
jgi:hypothetical protein